MALEQCLSISPQGTLRVARNDKLTRPLSSHGCLDLRGPSTSLVLTHAEASNAGYDRCKTDDHVFPLFLVANELVFSARTNCLTLPHPHHAENNVFCRNKTVIIRNASSFFVCCHENVMKMSESETKTSRCYITPRTPEMRWAPSSSILCF